MFVCLRRILAVTASCLAIASHARADNALLLAQNSSPADFPLVSINSTATLCYSSADAKVVAIATRDLAADIESVTGKRPAVTVHLADNTPAISTVLIGTLGQSPLIDKLVDAGKLDASQLRNKWESFLIATVDAHTLVIVGSDPRGTAYGVYELSQAIGVSPWYWWADVAPTKKNTVAITAGARRYGPPSVKYRGIAIGDEDWGLQPWAAKTFEPENRGIGPKTYQKIFELLLRLKANTLSPASRPDTPTFDSNPANATLAADYAIEIAPPPEKITPPPPATINAQEPQPSAPQPFGLSIFSDDGFGYLRSLPNADDHARPEGCGVYYHLSYLGKPLSYLWLATTPPALLWEEMRKATEHGADRLWIVNVGDIKPAEITAEFFLQIAWDASRWNADTLPNFLPEWAAREFNPELAPTISRLMNMYYSFNTERRPEHLQWWLPGEKPRPSDFTQEDRDRRRAIGVHMNELLASLRDRIPQEKQDAFYELIEYPVQASILANNRYLTGEDAALKGLGGDSASLQKYGYLGDVLNSQLARITHRYNALTASGKWNGIMQTEPADNQYKNMRLSAWRVPAFQIPLPSETRPPLAVAQCVSAGKTGATTQPAREWKSIPGLGRSGSAFIIIPSTAPIITPERAATDAPALVLKYTLEPQTAASATVARIHIIPAHALSDAKKLVIACVLDGDASAGIAPRILELNDNPDENNPAWVQGVLANERIITIALPPAARAAGQHTLRLLGIDPNVIIDRVTVE